MHTTVFGSRHHGNEPQRAELLRVAEKCPAHKLMTQVETVVETRLLPAV